MIDRAEGQADGQAAGATGKRRSGRPTQEESHALTERILDHAKRSFIERGFFETTIQQLSEDIGVTNRSIVSRYKTRDDLLIAVAKRDMEAFQPRLDELEIREEQCWEDLEALCRRLFQRGCDQTESALLRAYLGEAGRLPALSDAIRDFYYYLNDSVERRVVEAQRFGLFRNFKSSTVATCAVSLFVANPRIRTMLLDPHFDDAVNVERFFTDLWTLIREMA